MCVCVFAGTHVRVHGVCFSHHLFQKSILSIPLNFFLKTNVLWFIAEDLENVEMLHRRNEDSPIILPPNFINILVTSPQSVFYFFLMEGKFQEHTQRDRAPVCGPML